MKKPISVAGPSATIAVAGLAILLVFASSCRIFRHRGARKKDPAVATVPSGGQTARPDTAHSDNADPNRSTASDVGTNPRGSGSGEKEMMTMLSALADNSRLATWSTFYAKADVHYEGKGDSKNFDIDVRIERDKRIWIRVIGSLLGIKGEGARLLITADSIQALDKMNSVAYLLPWSNAGKLLPAGLDFATLQTLLTGGAFNIGGAPAGAADEGVQYSLSAASSSLLQTIVFQKVDKMIIRQDLRSTAPQGPALTQVYSDYRSSSSNGIFPFKRKISIEDKGQLYKVDLDFSKVEWNNTLEYPFTVPVKYERR